MQYASFLLVVVLCYFPVTRGKADFDGLFQFENRSYSDIVKMRVESVIKEDDVVTKPICRKRCINVSDDGCHGVVFSVYNSEGCEPDVCDKYYPHEMYGECFLLKLGDQGKAVLSDHLNKSLEQRYMPLPPKCRSFYKSDDWKGHGMPYLDDITRDPKDKDCYIYNFRCGLGDKAARHVTCCDHETAVVPEPFSPICNKNTENN